MGRLFDRAISPSQYDSANTGFIVEAADVTTPSRKMFWNYLQPYADSWKNKDVLDIGSGTGWLLHILMQEGVKSATGIEPSQVHVDYARKHFPETNTIHGQFEDLTDESRFDVAIAIMSLVHIRDLSTFFQKLDKVLRSLGRLYAIVPDFDYYRSARFGYVIHTEERSPDEYAIEIVRDSGTIADVARTSPLYAKFAQDSGFVLEEDQALMPTPDYIRAKPQYEQFSQTAINRLLIFRKK